MLFVSVSPCTRLTPLPRAEVATHDEVVEGDSANELEQLSHDLLHDAFLHVVALETLPNLVEEVENIVHAGGRLVVVASHADHAREHASTAVGSNEPWQRLRLDEGRNDHLAELLLDFKHPGVVDVILETVKIVLDDADETLICLPVELPSSWLVHARCDTLLGVEFGNADE